ncbi:MAG: twin-arginine translocase TatA/TatE family subunit [Kiritimatiellaeota bacterium]|nr:twin-arginine translocase TatA/TatE family subunit [Kiritimatiellota bacterium]
MIGPFEILMIFFVVLLFFGGRKIPEVARGLGKALGEFNKAKDDIGGALKVESPYPAEFADKSLRKKLKSSEKESKKDKSKKGKKDKKKNKKKDKKKK